MLTLKATTVSFKKLLLWLFLISLPVFLFSARIQACDSESFVFEEFGRRCQRISDYIKDLQIARKMELPAASEKRGRLLNEWVDFYLDHGQAPPASFTMMTNKNWSRTLTKAGETIGQLAYDRIPPDQAETACITFDLLAQPPKLETAMALIASWTLEIELPAGETVEQTSEWLFRNLRFQVELYKAVGESYPVAAENHAELIKSFNQQWKFVVQAPADTAATVYRFTRDELVTRLKQEFERWRQLIFM